MQPGDAARFGESWPTLGVVEGIYDAYFNQIYARNIIKHSETQITKVFIVNFIKILRQKVDFCQSHLKFSWPDNRRFRITDFRICDVGLYCKIMVLESVLHMLKTLDSGCIYKV